MEANGYSTIYKNSTVSCEHRALGQAEKLYLIGWTRTRSRPRHVFLVMLMAILPFFVNSKVSISLLASRFRTISEWKVVRFSMSRHAWNYQDLWELEGQRASCEFEAVRARHEFRDRRRRRSPLSLKRLAQLSRLNGVKYHFEQSCVSRSRRRLADSFWRANFSLLSGGEIKK